MVHRMDDNLVPTREAAKRLGVDPSTIRRRVRRGELAAAERVPGYNGDLFFDEATIAALELEAAAS